VFIQGSFVKIDGNIFLNLKKLVEYANILNKGREPMITNQIKRSDYERMLLAKEGWNI